MFSFNFGKSAKRDDTTVRARLNELLNSEAHKQYSLRKLQEQEQATMEAKRKLDEELKVALEQKANRVNPNASKPKLTLKRK